MNEILDWRTKLEVVAPIAKVHGTHHAVDYMIGEVFFALLMQAKEDPGAASEVKPCAQRIAYFLHVGGRRDYLRSSGALYRAARATNPLMGKGSKVRAAQLLKEAWHVLVESKPVNVRALPKPRQSSSRAVPKARRAAGRAA